MNSVISPAIALDAPGPLIIVLAGVVVDTLHKTEKGELLIE